LPFDKFSRLFGFALRPRGPRRLIAAAPSAIYLLKLRISPALAKAAHEATDIITFFKVYFGFFTKKKNC
jgi:hypothetical protein